MFIRRLMRKITSRMDLTTFRFTNFYPNKITQLFKKKIIFTKEIVKDY